MESADGPTPSKKAKLSPAPINELPDFFLVKIFALLPFKDRHQLCLVSPKWAAASRIPWSDITFLDLSTIPRAMVDSILGLCPMLQELHAKDFIINLEQKPNPLSCANLRHVAEDNTASGPRLLALRISDAVAMSLRRLVLANHSAKLSLVNEALRGLQNLECLYLEYHTDWPHFLCALPNIREFCFVDLGDHSGFWSPIVYKMPKLEVFIYASRFNVNADCFMNSIASSLSFRILVIAGVHAICSLKYRIGLLERFYEPALHEPRDLPITVNVPARDLSKHIPPLQIFVGGEISKYFRFTTPPSANFRRIDCPMPEYLAKPEVAEVFKDVWLAKIIREGPENGLKPWGHPDDTELFYSPQNQLLFC